MCSESRLASLRGSRLGINMDSSLKTRPSSVELIVPNNSPRRVSGGVLQFSAVYPTGHGTSWFRSIGDNRSTIPAAASCSVELLSPKAPTDALTAESYSVELLSPIAPPDALAAAACGFRLFIPPPKVLPGSDRLGTIDLPSQRRL
jgi:hypothetical protein